jgi:hypothetical protein
MLEDTAVVICFYNQRHQLRLKAAQETFAALAQQHGDFTTFVVELVFPGDYYAFNNISEILYPKNTVYLFIQGEEQNRYLCQKEALYNIALQQINEKYKYLVFIDADVAAYDKDWIVKVREKLAAHDDAYVNGYVFAHDTYDNFFCFFSAAYRYHHGDKETMIGWNPGMCVGIGQKRLREVGGWNPWQIVGGGDSIFYYENIGLEVGGWHTRLVHDDAWSAAIYRPDLPKTTHIEYTESVLKHFFHGYMAERKYKIRRHLLQYGLDLLGQTIFDAVEIDDKGLMAFKDPNSLMVDIVKNKDKFEPDTYQEQVKELYKAKHA